MHNSNYELHIHTVQLRRIIGWLGIALPWISSLLVFFTHKYWPDSISATYYTNANIPFLVILGSAGLLLLCYKGYDWLDDLILKTAGVAALCICAFPCEIPKADNLIGIHTGNKVGIFMLPHEISHKIHLSAAIVFFFLLVITSIFLFTKSSGEMTPEKKIRNIIYRVCGHGIAVSFAILAIKNLNCKMWLMEVFALTFFGISFLTKAGKYRCFFCDPTDHKKEQDLCQTLTSAQNIQLNLTLNIDMNQISEQE